MIKENLSKIKYNYYNLFTLINRILINNLSEEITLKHIVT